MGKRTVCSDRSLRGWGMGKRTKKVPGISSYTPMTLLILSHMLARSAYQGYAKTKIPYQDCLSFIERSFLKKHLSILHICQTLFVTFVVNSKTYEEDETLQGYVMDLQKFENLLKQEIRLGNVEITENEIKTEKTFEL